MYDLCSMSIVLFCSVHSDGMLSVGKSAIADVILIRDMLWIASYLQSRDLLA